MTKKERTRLREAIEDIMADDGDYLKGLKVLADLAGLKYPAGEIIPNLHLTTFAEVAKRPNSTFKCPA